MRKTEIEMFCSAFVRTGQAMKAVRWAFCNEGAHFWSESKLAERADELLSQPKVRRAIDRLRRRDAAEEMLGAREIIREWVTIVRADPAELVRPVVDCCRHCWGHEGGYQWRDEAEWVREVERQQAETAAAAERGEDTSNQRLPECDGGFGYDRTRPVNPECRSCDGVGNLRIVIQDIHELSPEARKLFRGVKTTQHGVEVLMADKERALENLAKVLGIYQNPIQVVEVVDGTEAAALTDEVLQSIITGKLPLSSSQDAQNVDTSVPESDDQDDFRE